MIAGQRLSGEIQIEYCHSKVPFNLLLYQIHGKLDIRQNIIERQIQISKGAKLTNKFSELKSTIHYFQRKCIRLAQVKNDWRVKF